MIIELIGFFILIFTAIRLGVAVVNLLTGQWLHPGKVGLETRVSVLIPARNEEKNISSLLDDLLAHDYNNLEIIVYDDLSTDKTLDILENYSGKDPRVRVLVGKPLPEGWLGKNHACHNLALEGSGEYLLFLDADVSIQKGLVASAIAHSQKHNLALFSIFPVQRMLTLAEKLTVPLMNWILVSLLPLILTRISRRVSLSAANGQFMLFRAETYRKELFHQRFKSQKVEDILIFRDMKKRGYKVHTVLGNNMITCRMYDSWNGAVQGFSKNVFEFFGGSRVVAFLFGIITTFGFVAVALALPFIYLVLYFAMVILLRAIVSAISRQNVFFNSLTAPLQQMAFLYVVIKAMILQKKKATLWKGRNVDNITSESFS
jgi:glycosyltransferase involved in cell wall biosynthesis